MLTAAQLLQGYSRGIFPMAKSAADPHLDWFDPPLRGLLPVGEIHASRSLLRSLKRGGWSAGLNVDFNAIVAACGNRDATWINRPLIRIYDQLHRAGYAHALEVRQDGAFAGGIFGVILGGAFFGESMVSTRTDGSKMALLWMSNLLARSEFTLFDTQFLTPHLASMGGFEVTRKDYHRRLAAAISRNTDLRSSSIPDAGQLWQEITHTS